MSPAAPFDAEGASRVLGGLALSGALDSPTLLPEPWASDPYLLSNHGASRIHEAWTVPGALVTLTSGTGREPGILGLGEPAGVARLLRAMPREAAAEARWLTVARGTSMLCPEVYEQTFAHLGKGSTWDWMWTGEPLRDADPEGVERLPVGEPEVEALLAVAHPLADTAPDDPRLIGWWGWRDGGALVAVTGALRFAPGLMPYLVSVAVHPDHRGKRLAGKVMAAAVLDGLAEQPRVGGGVSLALYASNETARRSYLRHGFELRHEFESVREIPACG